MKCGETVTVERVPSGLYEVTLPNGVSFVGAAASTILTLTMFVFKEEASGDMLERDEMPNDFKKYTGHDDLKLA